MLLIINSWDWMVLLMDMNQLPSAHRAVPSQLHCPVTESCVTWVALEVSTTLQSLRAVRTHERKRRQAVILVVCCYTGRRRYIRTLYRYLYRALLHLTACRPVYRDNTAQLHAQSNDWPYSCQTMYGHSSRTSQHGQECWRSSQILR